MLTLLQYGYTKKSTDNSALFYLVQAIDAFTRSRSSLPGLK